MSLAARLRGWPLIALTVFALALSLRTTGYLTPFEQRAADARARILQHEVDTDIVIVGIDARSLADLQQWPWPRRYHARVLERLAEAKPRRVFADIDFSARTQAEDDAALASALARFDDRPVILPVFFQRSTGAASERTITQPLEGLREHAALAGVNFLQDADSLVREAATAWDIDGVTFPSAVAAVAGTAPTQRVVPIDYSISPASFDFISYVDLLAGRVTEADLRGKTVMIGATAVELNDMLPVPVYRFQPGVVVQALAAQSLREGALYRMPEWLNTCILAALAVLGAVFFSSNAWRRNLLVLGASLATLCALNLYAYSSHRLMLELIPLLLVPGGAFLVATLRSLDQETLRALAYALGIRRRDALLGSIIESSTDCIVCINQSGRIEMANAAGARLFGCEPADLVGTSLSRFVPVIGVPSDSPEAFADLCGRVSEQHALRLDGSELPIEISISPVHIPDERLYTVIVRDITERKAQQRKLHYQATHDPLTALPNRAALTTHLERSLARSPAEPVALLMLDLCRFKEVNDTLGHDIGDRVLCEVARRFEAVTRPGLVARIGGDEFTVVLDAALDAAMSRAAIIDVCEALHDSLRAPISAAGIAIDIGVSIGIALFPDDAADAVTLLRRGDVAMYLGKRRGSNWEFYDPSCDQNTVRRLAMVSELRSAIANGRLNLFYQPQVTLANGRSESVEALLRWKHPEYGAVSPAEFIAIAESTDLIRPLTEWTIQQALTQAAQWRRTSFTPRIAVNLSARLLQDVDFPALLRSLLENHQVPAHALELEITESAMMQDPTRALRVIREIHQLGVFMSVDDFGTGFSSLAYLRDLPVHALKLDKSFVQRMHERAEDRSIVNSTVRMAHELGLQVVAEGVETDWAAQYLASAGYDYAQGYLYSPALPADQCRTWMMDFNAPRRATA